MKIWEHFLGITFRISGSIGNRWQLMVRVGRSIAIRIVGGYDRGFGDGRRLTSGGVDLFSLMYSKEADEHSISVPVYVDRHAVMEDDGQDPCAEYLGPEIERLSLSDRATKKGHRDMDLLVITTLYQPSSKKSTSSKELLRCLLLILCIEIILDY